MYIVGHLCFIVASAESFPLKAILHHNMYK
jgi:hypothetical protein